MANTTFCRGSLAPRESPWYMIGSALKRSAPGTELIGFLARFLRYGDDDGPWQAGLWTSAKGSESPVKGPGPQHRTSAKGPMLDELYSDWRATGCPGR